MSLQKVLWKRLMGPFFSFWLFFIFSNCIASMDSEKLSLQVYLHKYFVDATRDGRIGEINNWLGSGLVDLSEKYDDRLLVSLSLGGKALLAAARYGHEDVIQELLDSGAEVDDVDNKGRTSLIYAALYGHKDVIQVLLDNGVEVDDVDRFGNTALMYAALNGYENVVQMLLDNEADFDIVGHDGSTALMDAILEKREPIVQMLLARGADVSVVDRDGSTALMLAVDRIHPRIVQLLLKANADTSAVDRRGGTALIYAVRKLNPEIVQLLLKANADTSAVDSRGGTALIYAAQSNNETIVQMLLKRGVIPPTEEAMNKFGLSNCAKERIKKNLPLYEQHKDLTRIFIQEKEDQSLLEKDPSSIIFGMIYGEAEGEKEASRRIEISRKRRREEKSRCASVRKLKSQRKG